MAGVSTTAPTPSSAERTFNCPKCSRKFSRKEHMRRHELTHNPSSRLHQCPDCSRSFTRQDALHRHRSLHSPTEPLLTEQILNNPRRKAAVFRSRQACVRCSRLKLKCGGNLPCQRCLSKPEGTCYYPPLSRDNSSVIIRQGSSEEENEDDDDGDDLHSARSSSNTLHRPRPTTERDKSSSNSSTSTNMLRSALSINDQAKDIQQVPHSVTFDEESNYDRLDVNFAESFDDAVTRHVVILDSALEQHHASSDERMLDDLQSSLSLAAQGTSPDDIMPASDFDWLFAAQTPTSRLDQASESWAWSLLIDNNQRIEQQMNAAAAAGATPSLQSQQPSIIVDSTMMMDTPLNLLSSTALSTIDSSAQQLGHYRRTDGSVAETEPRDLRAPSRRSSLPGGIGGSTAKDWPNSWYPQEADMRLNAEFFENATDAILLSENSYQVEAFDERAKIRLLSICQSAELPDSEAQQVYDMLASVSVPTYNILVQLFFERFQPGNPFIHRETFSPTKCNSFLLGCVCAFGTFYTRTPKARSLGNVLIDLVHRAIILTTTRNNLHARSLSNIQALVLICIYFGNAGNRRFLEHAEACRGAVITMVRRCRLLDHVDEPLMVVTSRGGNEVNNEERWKAWLHWETGRRTGWASFVADMELSSTWSLPTAFLLTELKTTIPSNEDLWEAPNAEIWASIYRSSLPSPTIDRLHEAFSQSTLANELDHLDLFQSLLVAQSLSLVGQSIMEMSYSRLATHAEPLRKEFVKCIEDSLASKPQHNGSSNPSLSNKRRATCQVILGFVLLRVHVSLQDLQAVCGRRGSAQAKVATEQLEKLFIKSPQLSHSLARHCAEIVHLVRTHTIQIACLSTTTFYAVVFLYAYSRHQSKDSSSSSISNQNEGDQSSENIAQPGNTIILEKIGNLAGPKASQRLLTTMSHFFLAQLANRTWPTCKNLGSILSDMATRESSPVS